jgi:hypothetical protein
MNIAYQSQSNGRNRIAQIALWIGAILFMWLALSTAEYDPSNNHAVALFAAPLFLALAIGLEVLLRQMVQSIYVEPRGFWVETMFTIGTRRAFYQAQGMTLSGVRESAAMTSSPSIYQLMRVPDRRWPLIIVIDRQSVVHLPGVRHTQ